MGRAAAVDRCLLQAGEDEERGATCNLQPSNRPEAMFMSMRVHSRFLVPAALISLVWLAVVCVLGERFRVPSGDGIMYSLPFAVAKNPFDLGIPFLDDFQGYGSSWGHNWPGSMWVKGIIFMVLPYSRMMDVMILSLFQLLAAMLTGLMILKACGKMPIALAAFAIILSDRLLLLTCSGNRFESIALAAVLVLYSQAPSLSPQPVLRRCLGAFAAFLCPVLHPYALVLAGIIIAHDFLATGKKDITALKEPALRLMAFLLGCMLLAGWFVLDAGAWHQFSTNVKLQKSFYTHWDSVLAGLSNYRMHSGLILWSLGLICVFMTASGCAKSLNETLPPLDSRFRLLGPLLLIATIIVHTLTRCENYYYLVFGTPFAVITAFSALSRVSACMPPPVRWMPLAGIAAVTLLHATILPHRLFQFWKAGMPDLGQACSDVLNGLPHDKTVFIPHPLWAAACEKGKPAIRWFTFPVVSSRMTREAYEKLTYADAKPGDILIIENSSARQPDKFGNFPTFATTPPDPERWRHLSDRRWMFSGSSPWGIDLSLYEFIR
jgi:hypothetical protein